MNSYCMFCHSPCGDRDFCDETCYSEYYYENQVLADSWVEELSGEYRYNNASDVEDWDVNGGL